MKTVEDGRDVDKGGQDEASMRKEAGLAEAVVVVEEERYSNERMMHAAADDDNDDDDGDDDEDGASYLDVASPLGCRPTDGNGDDNGKDYIQDSTGDDKDYKGNGDDDEKNNDNDFHRGVDRHRHDDDKDDDHDDGERDEAHYFPWSHILGSKTTATTTTTTAATPARSENAKMRSEAAAMTSGSFDSNGENGKGDMQGSPGDDKHDQDDDKDDDSDYHDVDRDRHDEKDDDDDDDGDGEKFHYFPWNRILASKTTTTMPARSENVDVRSEAAAMTSGSFDGISGDKENDKQDSPSNDIDEEEEEEENDGNYHDLDHHRHDDKDDDDKDDRKKNDDGENLHYFSWNRISGSKATKKKSEDAHSDTAEVEVEAEETAAGMPATDAASASMAPAASNSFVPLSFQSNTLSRLPPTPLTPASDGDASENSTEDEDVSGGELDAVTEVAESQGRNFEDSDDTELSMGSSLWRGTAGATNERASDPERERSQSQEGKVGASARSSSSAAAAADAPGNADADAIADADSVAAAEDRRASVGNVEEGMRFSRREAWSESPSSRDMRLQLPSTVEVDVFSTPYEHDDDLPSGFAERRMEADMLLRRKRDMSSSSMPLHHSLPADHPDRDDTAGAAKYYLTPEQAALVEEEAAAAMNPRMRRIDRAFGFASALAVAAMAIYAVITLNEMWTDTENERADQRSAQLDVESASEGVGALYASSSSSLLSSASPPISSSASDAAAPVHGLSRAGQAGKVHKQAQSPHTTFLLEGGDMVADVASTSTATSSSSGGDMENDVVALPSILDDAFEEITYPYDRSREVPFFWNVQLAGGDAVEGAFGSCLRLIQASKLGCTTGKCVEGEPLQIVEVYGESYVSVDLSIAPGIARAVELGLGTHPILADVVYSPLLYNAARIFLPQSDSSSSFVSSSSSSEHPRGRIFALFRHPVKRAISAYFLFHDNPALRSRDGGPFPENLAEYAVSTYAENNPLTRMLVDRSRGDLTDDDVSVAKEILRRKFLVGLYGDEDNHDERRGMYESVRRFRAYYGLDGGMSVARDGCLRNEVRAELDRTGGFVAPGEGSEVYAALLDRNRLDMAVYEYAVELYEQQGRVLFGAVSS